MTPGGTASRARWRDYDVAIMFLAATNFAGFDLGLARVYLNSFDARTRKKGEGYYRGGAVKSLACGEPGSGYSAKVLGSDLYEVTFWFEDEWDAECTCPVEYGCKHAYAAWKKLLEEHSAAMMTGIKTPVGKYSPAPVPDASPPGFAATVQEKLGRKLAADELRYLKTISQLFHKSLNGGLNYVSELTGLGFPQMGWWERLELYPRPPRTEAEFWNYLALYITEKTNRPVPDFMQPVTDLRKVQAAMRKHFRARDIAQWNHTLAQFDQPAYQTATAQMAATTAELRVRFLRTKLEFEWRLAGGNEWKELKPRKTNDFEAKYAPSLSVEAALLWLPYWQRTKVQYATNFDYNDAWVGEQAGRWLRHPLLRPLLVNESGEPLVIHDAPLRWHVVQPEDVDGDYSFSLVQADGQPVPDILLAAAGRPVLYLTSAGVFSGPPFDYCVKLGKSATLIPAKAFESAGGLRLLGRLQVAPPPRLAARIRTVTQRPGIRAAVNIPGAGPPTEACYVDVYSAHQKMAMSK